MSWRSPASSSSATDNNGFRLADPGADRRALGLRFRLGIVEGTTSGVRLGYDAVHVDFTLDAEADPRRVERRTEP